jgi:hypothetical protein
MTKHPAGLASYAWLVLMAIVWALFVPKGLSVGTFTLFTLAAPLALLATARGAGAARPARAKA